MIPPGYNPDGLQPIIKIMDIAGNVVYSYDSFTRIGDFLLEYWSIDAGISLEHGSAFVVIRDNDNALIDMTDPRRPSKIKQGYSIEIWLGKSADDIELWFAGPIQDRQVELEGYGRQVMPLVCYGRSIWTARRLANIQHSQRLTEDGLAYDTADNNAKLSEIFKRMLTDSSVLAVPGVPLPAFDVSNVDDITVQFPQFNRAFQRVGTILSELANTGDCVYGIDPDGKVFLHYRGTKDSAFLISNDVGDHPGDLTLNWDSDKLMILADGVFSYTDSGTDAAYSVLHGLGAQYLLLGHESLDSNASRNLNAGTIAMPFTAAQDNIRKVTLYMSKTADVSSPLHMQIIGSNEDGTPNIEDVRQALNIRADRLNRELGVAGWLNIVFEKIQVTQGEKLYILLPQYIGTLYADYKTGEGEYYINGAAQVGSFKMRVYASKNMHIIAQDVTASRKYYGHDNIKEKTLDMQGYPDEDSAMLAVEAVLNVASKERRTFKEIVTSTPARRPLLGKTLRVIDRHKGADFIADLVGYRIQGDVRAESNMGAIEISIMLGDYHY